MKLKRSLIPVLVIILASCASDHKLREWAEMGDKAAQAELVQRLHQLAEKGDAQAQCELGEISRSGVWVIHNDAVAAKWYGRSAQNPPPYDWNGYPENPELKMNCWRWTFNQLKKAAKRPCCDPKLEPYPPPGSE